MPEAWGIGCGLEVKGWVGPEEGKGESKETPQRKRFQEPERGWLCVLIGHGTQWTGETI